MALNSIGTKLVIEGEKEYKKALAEINAVQKELRSEMKLLSAEYDGNANSMDALQKKNEILTKQTEEQSKKIDLYTQKLQEAQKAQEDSGEKVDKLSKELEQARAKMEEMGKASGTSKEEMEKQAKAVEDLENELKSAKGEFSTSAAATSHWQTTVNNANAELINMNRQLEENGQYLLEAQNSTDRCATSIDEYGNKVRQAAEDSDEFGEKSYDAVNQLSEVLIASGISGKVDQIRDALLECADAAAVFETAVAKVGTVADLEAVSLGDIRKQILDTSGEIGVSANAIADATYNAISASVETGKAVEFAGTATKLAIGGFTDATTSVDILTTALNAYHMETSRAQEVSDMLVNTQNKGKTTVAELASAYGKVIPVAAAYNVDLANLSSSTAILTANGIATAEAITYQKAMLNELGDSGKEVAKVLEERTGKSFGELMKEGYSLGDVIAELGAAVNNDTAAFNEMWGSSEAGIGALSLLGSGAKKFNDVLDSMLKSTGATEQAFEKMSNTADHARERMETACENLKIAIGDELNESLYDLYETGTDAFLWATEFVSENPEVVKAIESLVVALTAMAGTLAAVKAAQVALNLVLNTNPYVLAASAITALVAAMGTFVIMSGDANSRVSELYQSVQENKKSLDDLTKSNETALVTAKSLAAQIVELNEKEKLSNEEKLTMRMLVDQLNKVMPDLGITINDLTGKIDGNTAALEDNLDAQLRSYEMQMKQEELQQIIEDLVVAKEALVEIEKQDIEYQEQYNKLVEENFIKYGDMVELYSETGEAEGVVMDSLKGKYEETQATIEELTNRYEELTEATRELSQATEEAGESTEQTMTTMVDFKGKTYELTTSNEELADTIKNLEESYDDAFEAAFNSIRGQVSLFEELGGTSDLTVEQMSKNIQSQTDVFNQYKDDLVAAKELVKQGLLDENMLSQIEAFGVEGAYYLREIVEASDESNEALLELKDAYQEMIDARSELTHMMADTQTSYTETMESILGITAETLDSYTDTTEETTNDIVELFTFAGTQSKEIIEGSMSDMESSITEGSEGLTLATGEMLDLVITAMNEKLEIVDNRSLVAYNIGKMIPDSMTQAVLDGTSSFVGAVSSMIDRAASAAIDRAKAAAAEIDKALGQAFQ